MFSVIPITTELEQLSKPKLTDHTQIERPEQFAAFTNVKLDVKNQHHTELTLLLEISHLEESCNLIGGKFFAQEVKDFSF